MDLAVKAMQSGNFSSVRACATFYNVPRSTLRDRLAGSQPHSLAHEKTQYLTNTEESTLVKTITRLTNTGFPASIALVRDIATEIRRSRIHLSTTLPPAIAPPSERWTLRFRKRHPEIKGIYTRQLENARFKAMSYDVVDTWFNAMQDVFFRHTYTPDRIFNMDESGFCVGTSATSRVLANIRDTTTFKRVPGRQEWITAIECVSASGKALPPLLIFKAEHLNYGWLPHSAVENWRFSTSSSGWTSDSHGYEWLTRVFEPETRTTDENSRRLLVLDGHSSHVTANVIRFCIEKNIDLLVLPPHTSHELQPLDVGVFSALKSALAIETDSRTRLDSGRISKVEWVEMYMRARQRAITKRNIESGFRKTGIWPLSPITVLERLKNPPLPHGPAPQTPPNRTPFDLSLLESSPPSGTDLHAATQLFHSTIKVANDVPSPAKRFSIKLATLVEKQNTELTTLRREIKEQKELIETRKKRKKGKRIALEGRFLFSTEEVLEIARKAEEKMAHKKPNKRRKVNAILSVPTAKGNERLASECAESDDDCIIVASSRVQ